MNRHCARAVGIIALTALLAATVSRCGRDAARADTPIGRAAPAAAALAVRVCRPEVLPRDASYPSSLYVEGDVKLAAKRTGVVARVLVDRGAKVRAGQPLALLETDVAAPELQAAEHELRLAEADFRRLERLRNEEVVSPQDFERAEIARALAASKVELQKAWLDRCTLRAPFDGTVVERWAVTGLRVQEEDGTPLFRIVSGEPLRARVDVPEERAGGIGAGSLAWVEPAGARVAIEARVVFVAPAADAASGTVPVIVSLARSDGLKPGAAVEVRFGPVSAGSAPRLRLPREAVKPSSTAGEGTLFVVTAGRVTARRVRVVDSAGGKVIVDGDLRATDEVVSDPPPGLADGAAVEVAGAGS